MVDKDLARVTESIRLQEIVVADLMAMGKTALADEARAVLSKFQLLEKSDRERRERLAWEIEETDLWN